MLSECDKKAVAGGGSQVLSSLVVHDSLLRHKFKAFSVCSEKHKGNKDCSSPPRTGAGKLNVLLGRPNA